MQIILGRMSDREVQESNANMFDKLHSWTEMLDCPLSISKKKQVCFLKLFGDDGLTAEFSLMNSKEC